MFGFPVAKKIGTDIVEQSASVRLAQGSEVHDATGMPRKILTSLKCGQVESYNLILQ